MKIPTAVTILIGCAALVGGGLLALSLDGDEPEVSETRGVVEVTTTSAATVIVPDFTDEIPTTVPVTTTTLDPVTAEIESRLSGLSLEQKAGQVVMLGFSGSDAQPVLDALDSHEIANVFVTSTNGNVGGADALRELVAEIQEAADARHGLGMLVATDQEGGQVERFDDLTSRTPWDWGLEVVARGEEALAEYRAEVRVTAEALCFAGVNTNFAPLLDVVAEPAASAAIGERSFASDPAIVAQLAQVAVEEYEVVRILPVVKHWPGHGATDLDSHRTLPTLELDRETWERVHGAPYGALIDGGAAAVMVGHLDASPVFDTLPGAATFSPAVITSVLRGSYGFGGLVVTDDLASMVGASANGLEVGDRAVAALSAGADLVLFSGNGSPADATTAAEAVVLAVREGRLSASVLDDAVRRVLIAKRDLGLFDLPMPRFAGCVPVPAIS